MSNSFADDIVVIRMLMTELSIFPDDVFPDDHDKAELLSGRIRDKYGVSLPLDQIEGKKACEIEVSLCRHLVSSTAIEISAVGN